MDYGLTIQRIGAFSIEGPMPLGVPVDYRKNDEPVEVIRPKVLN